MTSAGQGIETPGTMYQDVQCINCTMGMFGDQFTCQHCILGETFSDASGSTNCSQCQECPGKNFSSLCTVTQDNVCISECPESWDVHETTRLCSKCALGYYDTGNNGTLEEQCVVCPANSYCEPDTGPQRCPDIM